MIDTAGYRYGVGIILVNDNRQVFFAKRIGMLAWQFPQGGMKEEETPEQTMFRELKEEVGLNPEDVEVLASTRRWLRYRLPSRLIRHYAKPLCIGQRQKWFLLRLTNKDAKFDLQANNDPEFDSWEWVPYWHPLRQVVTFKRRVYVMALKEFAKIVLSKRFRGTNFQRKIDTQGKALGKDEAEADAQGKQAGGDQTETDTQGKALGKDEAETDAQGKQIGGDEAETKQC